MNNAQKTIKEVPPGALETLASKRIFFAHQSIGFNIIEGLEELKRSDPGINIEASEAPRPDTFRKPVLGHIRAGKNRSPESKLEAFEAALSGGIGEKVDIAFVKFCYLDINSRTDINEVLVKYKETMTRLKTKYPKIRFVHFTVPLMSSATGVKASLKRLLGMEMKSELDNMKRNSYNELLRKEYLGNEPLFDIAEIESTYGDKSRSSFRMDGKTYYSLAPEYTNDGGHLNETGRKLVAERLVIFLSGLAGQSR